METALPSENKELEERESFIIDHLARGLIMVARDMYQKNSDPALIPIFTSA